ncbi:MAG: SDR family oxidoreductase [Bacteroidetes bacterium]|nr:SDR family oxidoreductase [Bacteroidota bacterium]
MDIKGSQVVITGVSKGMGLSLAKQLLEKGATVYGWGRTAPKDDLGPGFQFIPCDIRQEPQVRAAAEKTLEWGLGRVDVLVNNAGLGYFGQLENMDLEVIDAMVFTNLLGTIYSTRALLPTMKKAGKGHIMNISSIAGLEAYPQVSVYCATKFAVTGFSESLYKELREYGIKVTCIHPGSTQTNFFDNVESIQAHDRMMSPDEVARNMVFVLESSDNFLTNTLVFRPLDPKPRKA